MPQGESEALWRELDAKTKMDVSRQLFCLAEPGQLLALARHLQSWGYLQGYDFSGSIPILPTKQPCPRLQHQAAQVQDFYELLQSSFQQASKERVLAEAEHVNRKHQSFLGRTSPHSIQPVEVMRPEKKEDDKQVVTTVILAKLPRHVDCQAAAVEWLSKMGHGEDYDFLLFVGPHLNPVSPKTKKAYIFVNYSSAARAMACIDGLHMWVPEPGSRPIRALASPKVQGFEQCYSHFKGMIDAGTLHPVLRPRPALRA
eukprot:TRINITY_DN33101_c0_g1_i1.p1 TRINITY_DN33101_c0_g1~~TRINITY_DN33101_c0_g1_i1.p1  ORF type:complete len:257 (+),score=54.74 TRINITY_DN33101_c0_g1_i1:38-808(+)